MAISVDGLVSGINSTDIITKLMELERRPITLVQKQRTAVDEKTLAWQGINTKILALETASQKMNTAGEFQAVSGSFKNNDTTASDSIVGITVNQNITPSSFNFNVTQLAKEQRVRLDGSYSSPTDPTGTGLLTIETASSGTFTFTGGSLYTMAADINAANIGRTATIINAGTSASPAYKLLIANDNKGADYGFSVYTDDGFGGDPYMTFTTTQEAQDSIVQLDGITITRSSNTISDLVPGATFELSGTGDGTITFASDATSVIANVKNMVQAYNDMVDAVNSASFYNSSTKQTGALYGSAGLRNMEQQIRSLFTSQVDGLYADYHNFSSLSQIGIKTDSSNKLVVDDAVLEQAVRNDVKGVTKLFVSAGSGTYSFVSATGATTAKRYDTRVTTDGSGNKVIEMRSVGTSSWVSLIRDGSYWSGQTGTATEGLIIRAPYETLTSGSTGTMDISVGLAEKISYLTGYLTEYSSQGAIFNQQRSLEDQAKKLDKEIADMETRLTVKQQTLQQHFVAMETTLSSLKGKGDYLTQQLNYLPGRSTR